MFPRKIFFYALLVVIVYSCTNPNQIEIDLSQSWKFKKGDNLEWANPEFNDSNWDNIDPSVYWEKQGHEGYDGYAWYRIKFFLPYSMKIRAYLKDSIQIVLGKIDDTDQTFLNGKLIGQNGKIIPYKKSGKIDSFEYDSSAYSYYRVYKLNVHDARIRWDKENTLAVRVHDHMIDGGMYSKQKSISMLDIKDYLIINANAQPFIFKSRNHLSKNLKIKNISVKHKFEGLLKISIINVEKDTIVFEKLMKIKLRSNEETSIPFNFYISDQDMLLAEYTFREKNSRIINTYVEEVPNILTPEPPKTPKINGAKVFGVKPESPFIYTIAATGERPMRFYTERLPYGLMLDSITGMISGKLFIPDEYNTTLIAKNKLGIDRKNLKIIVGNKIALTPPMGWNSWNVWGLSVDSAKVHQAAKSMKSSGLINHGWTYINIDDGWEAPARTPEGELLGNEKFRNMRALSDHVHALGLKIGIYSSPGPRTCGGYLGSYNYEYWDIWTWYKWRIDYVKYDWCSYNQIAKDNSLKELQKPYIYMSKALSYPKRDVVFSICQYGMGEVWKWGEEVEGNLWRTTGDIVDTWESMSEIGFNQYDKTEYAKPGHWNDPDMLVVGWLGWGENIHPTRLTVNEQYTHISLWCLLSAPLLLGCDLTKLDDFTLGLLTNDEVLAVNQDPLGKQATRIFKDGNIEAWSKKLEDGSTALGFFNRGEEIIEYEFMLIDLNLEGNFIIRDLWRQKDIGVINESLKIRIPGHGVMMTRFIRKD